MGRWGGAEVGVESAVEGSAEGWEVVAEVEVEVVVEVFSMDHLKRSLSLGSMVAACGVCCGFGGDELEGGQRPLCAILMQREEENREDRREWVSIVHLSVTCALYK